MEDLFQPYAPETSKGKKRLFTPVPLRLVAPNAITLFALCLGLTAIRFSYEGRFEHAVWAIIIAAALDGVDGRVARFFKGTSRFGVELDSLADTVNFGVAPALILYNFTLHNLRSFGWVIVLIYAITLSLRLARFNVMTEDVHRPEWKKDFFAGIPAPACAITSLLPLYFNLLGVPFDSLWINLPTGLYVLLIALLAVSNIPIYAGKTIGKKINRQWVLPLLLLSVACFGFMMSYKIESLVVIAVGYLISIPLSGRYYYSLEKKYSIPNENNNEEIISE